MKELGTVDLIPKHESMNWDNLRNIYYSLDSWDLGTYKTWEERMDFKRAVWDMISGRNDWCKRRDDGLVTRVSLYDEISQRTLNIMCNILGDILELRSVDPYDAGRRIMIYELIRGVVIKATDIKVSKNCYKTLHSCNTHERVEEWSCQHDLGVIGHSIVAHERTVKIRELTLRPAPVEGASVDIDAMVPQNILYIGSHDCMCDIECDCIRIGTPYELR